MAAGRSQSSPSGSKSHRTTLYCLRPTPPATGKRQRRWICNLLPVAAELGLMSARICNSGLPLKRICNSPAPQNSSAGNSVGYTSRRCNHFPFHLGTRRPFRTPAGHIRSAGDFHEGTVCCGTRRQLMKTPDSRSCPLREPMENRRVRSNGFRVTRFTSLRCVPVRLMSLSQVFCRNAKVEIQ